LSTTEMVPVRAPAAVGAKTTWKLQDYPAGTFDPHVFKEAGSVKSPVTVMPLKDSGDPPWFESVTVCAAEICATPVAAKVSPAAGVRETPGGERPIPDSVTVCERNWSETVRVPVVAPMAAGAEATAMVQLEWPDSMVPQLLTAVKLPPLTWTAIRVRALSPLLVSVTGCVGLDV